MKRSPGYLWWALLVLPLWLVLALCTSWEPVMGDGWGHHAWHRAHAVTAHDLYEIAKEIYLYENPRLGQLFTLLSYTPGPYHAIVTPLVELGVLALLTVLALGRWPSLRRSDDAFVALLVTAAIAACVPQIGVMLFYRPFTGNYTAGLALNLAWLVPYRLALVAPRPGRHWLAPVILVGGLVAGLCNEHTGLAFLALGGAASIVAWRRGELRVWMIAGLVGLAAGYVLLLTAPGQHARYSGLADQAGIVERIALRGVSGNLAIIGRLAASLLPLVPLVALGVVERRALGAAPRTATERWTSRGLALAGLACTLTLFASPKIGPRLFFASVALISAGLVGWLAVELRRRWLRTGCAIVAAVVVGFVAIRVLAIYGAVGPRGAIRLERLEHAAPGATVAVPRYPAPASRYFLGDDFGPERRASVAFTYGLAAVELEAVK